MRKTSDFLAASRSGKSSASLGDRTSARSLTAASCLASVALWSNAVASIAARSVWSPRRTRMRLITGLGYCFRTGRSAFNTPKSSITGGRSLRASSIPVNTVDASAALFVPRNNSKAACHCGGSPATSRRATRSRMVRPRSVSHDSERALNRSTTSLRFAGMWASNAHQINRGMNGSLESSACVIRTLATDNPTPAGNRLAVHASWARTTGLGSDSASATNTLAVADVTIAPPWSPSSRTPQARTCSSGCVRTTSRANVSSHPPLTYRAHSASSASVPSSFFTNERSSGYSDASARSPRSRRASFRHHLFGWLSNPTSSFPDFLRRSNSGKAGVP